MGDSVAISLSLLSLGPERKVKCYNRYFVNGYVFHTEEYKHGRKTYNNGVYIKGSTCSEFEVDYYEKLDTIDRGIRVDPQYGLVEINSKARLSREYYI